MTKQIRIGVTFLFFLLIAGATLLRLIRVEFSVYYGVLSLITFVAYGVDKRAAQQENRRIPELLLHSFAFLGGWPGAAIGQEMFRHKTVKLPFQILFAGTVILNLILLWRLLTVPEGTALLKIVV